MGRLVALREALLDPHRNLAKHPGDRPGRITRALRARAAVTRRAIGDPLRGQCAQLVAYSREVAVHEGQRFAVLDVVDDANGERVEPSSTDQRLGVLRLVANSLELCRAGGDRRHVRGREWQIC